MKLLRQSLLVSSLCVAISCSPISKYFKDAKLADTVNEYTRSNQSNKWYNQVRLGHETVPPELVKVHKASDPVEFETTQAKMQADLTEEFANTGEMYMPTVKSIVKTTKDITYSEEVIRKLASKHGAKGVLLLDMPGVYKYNVRYKRDKSKETLVYDKQAKLWLPEKVIYVPAGVDYDEDENYHLLDILFYTKVKPVKSSVEL